MKYLPFVRNILCLASLQLSVTYGINNGLGTTPEMGFNSWYAVHNHLTSPNYTWVPGYVLADDILNISQWFIDHNFLSLGYNRINLDDCIVVGRDSVTHELIPDPQAFPNGVPALANALFEQGFLFGWYSDRGNFTCSCWDGGLKRPGSRNYEALDAMTYAQWNISYLKEDSCFDDGVDTNGTYTQYALMRNGLNVTDKRIFFNICWGAGLTIASMGRVLGNAWRIAEDDGAGWVPILVNVDVDVTLTNYSGNKNDGLGWGWNDMGLLMVGGGGLSDIQGRSHFNLWSILANKLLISVDPRTFTATTIETLTNAEVIAIDQDPLGIQGSRIVPPVTEEEYFTIMDDLLQDAQDIAIDKQKAIESNFNGTYLPRTFRRKYQRDTVTHLSRSEVRAKDTSRAEIYLRPLVNQRYAMLFFNRALPTATNITCDSTCWASMNWASNQPVNIRDVWTHTNNGTVTDGTFTAVNVPVNGTVMIVLSAA